LNKAVGRRTGRVRRSDETVAAGPVLDNHLLAPGIRQLAANETRRDVGNTTRGVRDEDADRSRWIILRLRIYGGKSEQRDNEAKDKAK
jgi:hypothetical protein